jgi:toxic protein SymE
MSAVVGPHQQAVGHGRPNPPPQLTLTGKWLGQFGFTTGQRIEVITEPGRLLIRIAPTTEGTAL